MDYNEALIFLQDLCKFGINLGLDRIKKLLAFLDNPQEKIKTIHVAGTNGKGSTSAILTRILRAAGFKVGGYTSPHLHSYTERIRINNEDIPPEKFAILMAEIKEHLFQVKENTGEAPTEFEVLTALAFKYFSQENVDIAIIEVGMGGRLDSTNVIVPEVAVITPIGKDHLNFLGTTILEIAKEKAGIIKEGVPVVIAKQEPAIQQVLEQEALKLGAPIINSGEAVYQQLDYSREGQRFALQTTQNHYPELTLSLLGDHQLENATTAIICIEKLMDLGWEIPKEAILKGIAKAYWPGRMEYLKSTPPILLDGAHNPQGARALARAIPKYFTYKRVIMVLAILDDKDKREILGSLAPLGDIIVVTKVPDNPRNQDWQNITEIPEIKNKEIFFVEEPTKAIDLALQMSNEDDLVVITGSLYLLGVSRQYVLKFSPLA